MIWIFDPLHKLSRENRFTGYLVLTVFFARLAAWYGIEQRWGKA